VYTAGGQKRIEFGIADVGCGMLANVRRADALVTNHSSAIQWCLKRGNTSARVDDFWAQRLPEDATAAPFPGPIFRDEGGNHHAGLGLYHLRHLIRRFGGSLWIWTGDAEIMYSRGELRKATTGNLIWQGLAIEFEVIVPQEAHEPDDFADLRELARQLGFE
jgi:hypothetical protein